MQNLPRCLLFLIFTAGGLLAAPTLQVHWVFQQDMSTHLPHYAKSLEYTPPRVLDLSFPLGPEYTVTKMKEVPFATEYVPASKKPLNGVVTPATPTSFQTQDLGYKLTLQADQVSPFLRLLGCLTIRSAILEQSVFGELSGSVYADTDTKGLLLIGQYGDRSAEKCMHETGRPLLSENIARMARLKTVESPFQINALPGKTYALTLTGPEGPIKATVRCTIEP